jgi:ArsR family transcriptional regulator, arsenate/arsenite/antimonite-responsive transcriptional repressor
MKGTAPAKKRPSATAIDELEAVFKAFADTTRLRILALLGNNEVCVCHIHDSLGLPQPTVSRHLAYLRRSGLVAARRDGVWMHYRVSRSLDPLIQEIVNSAVDALQQLPSPARDQAVPAFVRAALRARHVGGRSMLCATRAGARAMIAGPVSVAVMRKRLE